MLFFDTGTFLLFILGRKVLVFFAYVEKVVRYSGFFRSFAKSRHLGGGQGKVDRVIWWGAYHHRCGECASRIFGVACLYLRSR